MSKHLRTMTILFVAVAFTAALSAVSRLVVNAQPPSPANTVEIVGVVQAVQGNVVTVNQLQIDISTARVKVSPRVGFGIKIEGVLQPTGTVVASEVTSWQNMSTVAQAEISGQIQSITGTQIVIGRQTIDISKAQLKTKLAVGLTVHLHVIFRNGQLIASEIEAENHSAKSAATPEPTERATLQREEPTAEATEAVEPEATQEAQAEADDASELTGTVQQVGNGFVVVAGQQIDISNAEVKGNLVAGTVVKLHVINKNGQLIAREIENGRLTETSLTGASGKSGDDKRKAEDNHSSQNAGHDDAGQDNGGHNSTSGSGSSGHDDGGHDGGSGGGDGGHDGSGHN